ncbi:prepilin-type N-terminal cleavage/methylation domain-containing protein [bacterium]|nr:prepilin-type N-terminal cleavage/methylation domain-containing protein [bacterium]
MNYHQTPYNKKRGFTLVEAIFSTLVASVVIGFVYNFFSQSTKGVSHSEAANHSIRELQMLSNSIRQDLYNVKPFYSKNGVSIELWNRPSSFKSYTKFYTPSVYLDGLNGGVLKTGLKPKSKIHIFDKKEKGVRYYRTKEYSDTWFLYKAINYGGDISGLEDAVVHINRNIVKPIAASVSEYYIFSKGQRLVYRHYLKAASGEILNYVEYLEDLPTETRDEISLRTYGKSDKGPGLISGFEIFPQFEFSFYPVDKDGDILEAKRFYISVHIKMDSKIRNKVSNEHSYDINFNVMNPHINNNSRYKGHFN